MTTIKQDSHVYRLLTFLSYVGEYPLCSLQLLPKPDFLKFLTGVLMKLYAGIISSHTEHCNSLQF